MPGIIIMIRDTVPVAILGGKGAIRKFTIYADSIHYQELVIHLQCIRSSADLHIVPNACSVTGAL